MELIGTNNLAISTTNYFCKKCQYKTSNKYYFSKHLRTPKHLMELNGTAKSAGKSLLYNCELCGFSTNNKHNFTRHKMTPKHLTTANLAKRATKTTNSRTGNKYECEDCGKQYKYQSGLWKHKQKCNIYMQSCSNTENTIIQSDNELIKIIMEENAKLHEDIRTLIPKIGNNNSTNSNNQSFNINFFLNETCKDAMNMKDFIENIKLTLENVIYASKNGVLDSSRKLIVQGLQDLELTERPIHCTDVKKNTMYIKDEGFWNMDKENENLKKILQNVSVKHMKGISEWIINNPYYMNTEGGQQEYVQMVKNITQDISGCKRDYKLTIKNICEETLVD